MPQISVVIPCYNAHEFLSEAIDSVRSQEIRDIEVIVVDDGSTAPETVAYLQTLPGDITVIRQENKGLAGARNTGIAASKSPVIVTLDADDRFAATFFLKALSILNMRPEIGIVSSYVQEFGTSNRIWRSTASDDLSLLGENRIVACCAFRKACWEEAGGYDEKMRWGFEDWEFWIRVTQRKWQIEVIPEPLFFYRKKNSSMLVDESRPRMAQILDYMLDKHRDWYLQTLKRGILEQQVIIKKNLTPRRLIGLLTEKLRKHS